VFVQFVFSAPSFCVWLRSTAKRDQSFICMYPAFGEGLHGRLSLGNPPALKQSFQVYREGTPSLAQAGHGKDRRELALAESKLPCHPQAPGASLALRRIRPIPHSTVGRVADRSAPSLWIARLSP